MKKTFSIGLSVGLSALALVATGCGEPFVEPMVLGGETISAKDLNEGRTAYMLNCYACHGEYGDGKGPASAYLRPPPRDFRSGVYKFAGVPAGDLPHTDDMVRLVRRGLTGTPMLAWDIPEQQLTQIFHYIKTFAPERWQKGKPAERIVPVADPWAGNEAEAITAGAKLYHVNVGCARCHPAYVTKLELAQWNKDAFDMVLEEIGDEMYRPSQKDSSTYQVTILPPDFLFHTVKTISPDDSPAEAKIALFRTITAGIGGTAMPVWKGSLSDKDLWALTHYTWSIIEKKDTPAAHELRAMLASQPAYSSAQLTATPAPGTEGAPAPAPEGGAAPAPAPAPTP